MNSVLQAETPLWKLASAYMKAKQAITEEGYASEIDWQESITFDKVTESYFLREAAWVILSSGMRETIIRKKFPEVSAAFFEWESAQRIAAHSDKCRDAALCCFNNPRKIDALVQVAVHVFKRGFQSVRESIQREGITYIMQLPYMGPVTSYHFAKNIGLPVAKPDRHLNRIANKVGYRSPQLLCLDIARVIGEKIAVVDLVLWRYATLHSDYLELFPSDVCKSDGI